MTPEDRLKVVAEALTWLNTPYHPQARIKGVGVDCAMLLAEVYPAAGITPPIEVGYYSPQFGLHREEEIFMNFIKQYGHEVAEEDALPGDCLLVKYGRCYSHGGILVDPLMIVHASAPAGAVILSSLHEAELMRKRQFFSVEA
jgi:cell wall-associated NlpC family hydrolase